MFNLIARVGRAGIGESEHAFILIETTGRGKQVARPARNLVTLFEQKPIKGEPLKGTVSVPVIQENDDGTRLVEIRIEAGETRRFKVTPDGQIIV